jgi:hypothetical protein
MEFKFSISDILEKFELEENEKENLVSLFEFTNYLFDDEENLTKTFKLAKKAREKLASRIEEMFESDIKEIEGDFPAKEEEKQSD